MFKQNSWGRDYYTYEVDGPCKNDCCFGVWACDYYFGVPSKQQIELGTPQKTAFHKEYVDLSGDMIGKQNFNFNWNKAVQQTKQKEQNPFWAISSAKIDLTDLWIQGWGDGTNWFNDRITEAARRGANEGYKQGQENILKAYEPIIDMLSHVKGK